MTAIVHSLQLQHTQPTRMRKRGEGTSCRQVAGECGSVFLKALLTTNGVKFLLLVVFSPHRQEMCIAVQWMW